MGLHLKRWFARRLDGEQSQVAAQTITEEDWLDFSADLSLRELAFWSCVNLIGNALSKCEFRTFVEGQEVKGAEYYLWNLSPNLNQSSSGFLHKLVAQLYGHGEALVIEQGGQLLVADHFSVEEYALYDNRFSQVAVGDFTFSRSFSQSEVLYFRLAEKNMRLLANSLYGAYQKLIAYGMKSYLKSRGTKGTLTVDALAAGDQKLTEKFEELKNQNFKTFAEAENAILPLYRGFTYTDLGSKTYSNEGTRDIRAMMNDVSDFTAKAFGIPPALLSGEVAGTGEALDQFLTFCVDPLTDMLAEEINRKRYGQQAFCAGSYVQIDTKCLKHVDLLGVSASIDKLIASGAFCVNDIRKVCGEAPLDEPWANQHFMTKNYENLVRGETNET